MLMLQIDRCIIILEILKYWIWNIEFLQLLIIGSLTKETELYPFLESKKVVSAI